MNSSVQLEISEPLVVVPPRTRLYRLEPIGLGTAMVECVASYIHRLAEAHGLPTWVLVRRELAPRFQHKSILGVEGDCSLFKKMGATINGENGSARETVQILETLTGHGSVCCLNFTKFGKLMAGRKLIRSRQAWCPRCLAEWQQNGQPVYQPLLWLLADLRFCPQHRCPLEELCSGCQRPHTPLGRYRWNGRCPRCLVWLSCDKPGEAPADPLPLAERDEIAVVSIPRLVVALQVSPRDPLPPVFPANVAALVEQRFRGNSAAMARVLRVTWGTVHGWARGLFRPSLASLLGLENCFGATASEWITTTISVANLPATRSACSTDAGRIHPLRPHHDPQIVGPALARELASTAYPPRSLRAVCLELGFPHGIAMRRFPKLARQIVARFKFYRTEGKRTREMFMNMELASAVNRLLHDGRSLSFYELAKVLPPHVSVRDKRVINEFKRLKQEAEDEMQAVLHEQAVTCP